jgi:hypothetical protein
LTDRSRSTPPSKANLLSNLELVTLAVYLLGGDGKEVDTEDVAMKAHHLAPGRFTWKKYTDQIDLEIIRVFLSDAKKEKNGAYLSGTGTSGWLLTAPGLSFAQRNASRVQTPAPGATRLSQDEKHRRRIEQARIATSDAFRQYLSGNRKEITRHAAEGAFRLNAYIVGDARRKKVQRIVNTLGDDDEIGAAVRFLAELVLKEVAR